MPVQPSPQDHPDADLVRRAHAAFKTGDIVARTQGTEPGAVIFTARDGRLVEAQHMAYDEHAWDEFFAAMPTWR